MTSPGPYAEAVVEARLDWGNLDAEFEARVKAATEKAAAVARRNLERIKLAAKIDLKANTQAFKTETQAKLAEMSLHVNVTLRPDLKQLRERLAALKLHTTVELRANTAKFNADVRAAMSKLSESKAAQIKVGLTITQAEFRRFVADLNRRLREANIQVPVGINLNEAAYRARLAALTRPVTQTVNVNTTGGGGGGLSSLNSALDGTNSRGRKLRAAGIASLIVAIGGAAGIAAGAVGALAAGIGAVGIAGGAGLATAVVGMQGIGDAFSAFSDQTASAGADAKAQGKAVEAAAKQMAAAEKEVQRANKGSLDAQKDLNQARKDAERAIEDVNFALKGTAIDEKDAALALARAREAYDQTFGDPTATGLDRAEAALGIDKALRRQDEVARRNNDLIEQAADANAKGVEGSDEVVAAKERVVEADERVQEANQQVIEANAAMQEALNGTSASADKVAEALAKLSPNARAFVLAMRELGPLWTGLKSAVQDAMFADLDSVFTNLAQVSIPTLRTGMMDVGTAINGAAKEFADFWSSAEGQRGLENIFAGGADFITAMQPGLEQATVGFLAIAEAARPVMDEIGASLGGFLGQIMQAFTDANESGALTQLLSTFADIMDGFGAGLNGLLDGLIEFGNIAGPIVGPLLQTLGESLGALAPSLGQLGLVFGEALIAVLPTLSTFISSLADGLVPVMPVLAGLLNSLMIALMPLIEPLSDILVIVGQALTEAIVELAPAIGPLGEAFASLIEAIAPMLPMAAKVISTLVQALAPALTKIFDALGPVIEQWLDGMTPVLEQLVPILADVAMQLGTAIADALIQIMPMLPTLIDSFSRIILALAPFIPQLVEIAVDLLPVLIDLFMVLVDTVLPPITTAIEFLATYVLPLVVSGIRTFAQEWSDRLIDVKNNIQSARDFIGGAVDGIAGFFSSLGDKVTSIWGGIVSTIKGAVGQIGKFLMSIPSFTIPDWVPIYGGERFSGYGDIGQAMVEWASSGTNTGQRSAAGTKQATPRYATGGLFQGKGGPTDDANMIRISNKEHLAYVTRAQAVSGTTLPLLDAINNGWVPSPEFLHNMVPGYASGGLVTPDQLNQFATGLEGKTYDWGGVNWGDCSGAMSALANYTAGRDAFGSRFATGNMAESLSAMGAIPGLGPAGSMNFGWYNGGPYGGHTAGTLPNGVNVEMGGARGDGQYGGQAAGADDPMFSDHAHFPPEFFIGGDPEMRGGTGGGTGNSRVAGGRGRVTRGGGGSGGTSGCCKGAGVGGGGVQGGGSDFGGEEFVDGGDFVSGAQDVFVVNWPGGYDALGGDAMASTADGALVAATVDPVSGAALDPTTGEPYVAPTVPGATDRMGGFDPTYYGDQAPYGGIEGANAWAGRQDFQSQFNTWGIGALKEILGQFAEPLGLEGLVSKGVDNAAAALARSRSADYQSSYVQDNKLADTMIFQNVDERKQVDEMERLMNARTTAAAVTNRNGG